MNSRQFTTDDFMMSETLGLVKTLGWKVVDGIILTIQVYNKYNFYLNREFYLDRESIVNYVHTY